MPLDILAALPLSVLCKYANDGYASEISDAVTRRLQLLNDRDIKDYTPKVRKSLFFTLQKLRGSTSLQLSVLQLDTSRCMLTSTALDRRIKGLQEIRDIVEAAADGSFWTPSADSITKSQVLNWAVEKRVVEVLIGESAHHELLRRGKWLFELLAEKGKLAKSHTVALWTSASGRHESYVRAVCDILASLPAYLTLADSKELYDTITAGADIHDEKYLQLITDFSLTVMRERKTSECYAGEVLFTLAITECNEAALSCLIRLLPHCRAQSLRDSFVSRAVQSFAQEHAVPQSLSVLFAVLEPLSKSEKMEVIRRSLRTAPLTVLATTSVNKYVEVTRALGITEDAVTADKTLHSRHMDARFKLLALLGYLDFKFDETSIEVLWKFTVAYPILPADCRLMYSWLIDRVEAKSLSAEPLLSLFRTKFNMAAATMDSFRTFRHLFLAANHAARLLEVSGLTVLSRRSENILGFDTLLSFAAVATDKKVNESAAALVVDCVVMLDSRLSQKAIWGDSRKKLIWLLREQSGRALQLCRALLELKSAPVYLPPGVGKVSVYLLLPGFCSERVALPRTAVVSELRQHAAFLLSVHHSKVRLSRFAREIPATDDSIPIAKLTESAAPVTVELRTSVADTIQPEALLASDDLYQCLLQLAGDSNFAQAAWDALMKLPRSATLIKQLQGMERSVLEIGNYESFPRMLYTLIAVVELGRSEGFASRFFRSREGIRLVIKAFEINVLRLDCSGAQTAKYMEVLYSFVSHCSQRQIPLPPASRVLHQSLNSLYSLSTKLTKGCQSAIILLRSMLEMCYSEESRGQFVASLAAHWRVREVMLNGLVRTELEDVRKEVRDWVIGLCSKPFALGEVMLWNALEILPTALSEGAPQSFFSLLTILMKSAPPHFSERLSDLCGTLLSYLQHQHHSPAPATTPIAGSLKLLRQIITALHLAPNESSYEFVLSDCLFSDKPLCRDAHTRTAGLKLLASMLQLSYHEGIVTHINAQFINAEWRSARANDWRVKAVSDRRPPGAYIGIRNTGWICYVISILQQLYMMPQVRADILSVEVTDENSALRQCQLLFAKLQYTEKPHIGLQRLCVCLESSVNISEQMDAEEFLNAFLSRLERELGPNRTLLLSHFEGLLFTETAGDCQHKGRSSERFLTLPLVVKNKKDVYDSLDCLIQGETLQGENAYLCDLCERKVSARRKVGIGHLPNTLLLVLRRFDFDLDTNQREKLHDYYEFPFDLDLSRYILEAQQTQENPPDYYTYRLRGIVVHTGDAEGGHYYCFIQDRATMNWVKFNDSRVAVIEADDILDEAFGGFHSGEKVEKVSSAYMLLYEREGKYEVRSDVFSELKRVDKPDAAVSQSAQSILQRITEKNRKVWSRSNTFSHEFADFVCLLLTKIGDRLEVYQLAASYFLTVVCRSEDRYALAPLYTKLQNRNIATDFWLLETLTNPYVTLELLVGCPHSAIRKLVIALARTASRSVSAGQKSVFVERLLKVLPYVSQQPTHYFELMHAMVTGCELKPEWHLEEKLICYVLNRPIEDTASTAATDEKTTLGYCNFPPPESHFAPSGSTCPISIGGLLATLSEVQLQYRECYITREFIAAVVPSLCGKTAARQAADFFSLLTRNDERGSCALLSVLFVDIEKAEYRQQKLILRIVGRLLAINDSVANERCAAGLSALSQLMYINRESPRFVSTVGLALVKWNQRNPLVTDWLSANNSQFGHWLPLWIEEISSVRSGPDAIDHIVIKQLKSLAVGCIPATLEDWDSDSEVDFATIGRVRRVNQTTKSWEFLVVLDNFGEVARAKFDRGVERVVWIESDEETLRPIG